MADPMTREQLAEIRTRVDGATAGPWTAEDLYVVAPDHVHIADLEWLADTDEEWAEFKRNTVFVAAARQDVPALLAEVERLRAEQVIDRQALDRAAADHAQLRVELTDTRRFLDQRRTDVFMWQQSYTHLEARARRLRAERDAARKVRDDSARVVEQLRKELAETTHALKVTGEKLAQVRGQRDRAVAERDRLTEQVKDTAAAVAAWENGTTAPHDALAAIRDQATGAAT